MNVFDHFRPYEIHNIGVIFDSCLKWSAKVANVANKASSARFALQMIAKFFTKTKLKTLLFFALSLLSLLFVTKKDGKSCLWAEKKLLRPVTGSLVEIHNAPILTIQNKDEKSPTQMFHSHLVTQWFRFENVQILDTFKIWTQVIF